MTDKDRKFFFEEDPELEETIKSGVFFQELEKSGIIKTTEGMDMNPLTPEPESKTKTERTATVEVEFGRVKDDYVLHVTPIHPRKNLKKRALLESAVKTCVVNLNKVVPPSLRVDIYLPQDDWEIKAISFIIRDGWTAWNLDRDKLEAETVPTLLTEVGAICMKA